MVIYQNVINPYKVSTFYQRNLYDDTYVAEDYFFKFSDEYKRAVMKMGLLIGRKAIHAQSKYNYQKYLRLFLGYASYFVYQMNPKLEKSDISEKLTDGSPRTGPTAKGPAKKESGERNQQPDPPKQSKQTAGTGNHRAVLTTDKRDHKRAAKDAVKGPLAHHRKKDQLRDSAPPEDCALSHSAFSFGRAGFNGEGM